MVSHTTIQVWTKTKKCGAEFHKVGRKLKVVVRNNYCTFTTLDHQLQATNSRCGSMNSF
jgi:hypothetical protein